MNVHEYMLLADGTVKVFEKIPRMTEVLEMLSIHGGTAYYWKSAYNDGWRAIFPDSLPAVLREIDPDTVPEVIKLAAMLK